MEDFEPIFRKVNTLATLTTKAERYRLASEIRSDLRAALAAHQDVPEEMSPEFTDTARAALLWVLWHHQGASSKVGQPIRFALGMGVHDRLSDHQLREAKRWDKIAAAPLPDSGSVDGGKS